MKTKIVNNGYIIAIGFNGAGEPISDEEYDEIQKAFEIEPKLNKNQYAKLKEDLTWEIFNIPEPEEEENEEDISFLDILTGETE